MLGLFKRKRPWTLDDTLALERRIELELAADDMLASSVGYRPGWRHSTKEVWARKRRRRESVAAAEETTKARQQEAWRQREDCQ